MRGNIDELAAIGGVGNAGNDDGVLVAAIVIPIELHQIAQLGLLAGDHAALGAGGPKRLGCGIGDEAVQGVNHGPGGRVA